MNIETASPLLEICRQYLQQLSGMILWPALLDRLTSLILLLRMFNSLRLGEVQWNLYTNNVSAAGAHVYQSVFEHT